MWREYDYHPGSDPESLLDFSDRLAAKLKPPPPPDPLAHPAFATTTTSAAAKDRARLFKWHSEHTTNSTASLHALVDNVIRHPDFDREHFADNSWKREFKQLGASFGEADDWRKAEVTIEVPIPKKYRSLEENAGAASFPVKLDNFWYRPLCGVIRAIVEDSPESDDFVWNPYRVFVTNEDGKAERLHGELYWSSAWIEEHERVQRKVIPPERPGHGLPRALFALMFGSDATHLSQFGTEHAWPDYVMAGNKTKYTRGCPSSHSVHHIAQFTELPDEVQDFIRKRTGGKAAKQALLTFCKREVMHASWEILLDDEFLEAYEFGMVLNCRDGVKRLIFPRIFTYSADYPEKVILASIKDKGRCLCPRCLVTRGEIHKLGQKLDDRRRVNKAREDTPRRRAKVAEARKNIYEKGYVVDSKAALPEMLQNESMTPNDNAFSKRLSHLLFNFFAMLVVDLLHEFELGVWKAIFIHMLRILQAEKKDLVAELDSRFRQMSTFGRSTIRKFHNNVSDMKRLGARDFEDILQCSIAAFDGLLPGELNDLFMDLLFVAGEWHGLAKLRLHTESTLANLRKVTSDLGSLLRDFKDRTDDMETKELPREVRARQRRAQANPKKKSAASGEQPRTLNLETYKLHALGDYAPTIERIGTTDNYDSRLIELTHRQIKRRNRMTNHNNTGAQLAAHERREARLRLLVPPSRKEQAKKKKSNDPAAHAAPEQPYNIAVDEKFGVDISEFVGRDDNDPATKVRHFFEDLKSHLLERMKIEPDEPDERYSESLRQTFTIVQNKLYLHRTLRINYTTYDVRRDQDSINPRTSHRDVMFLSQEERANAHPYWYARVLSIFHVNVLPADARPGMAPKRFDVLWIRWFGDEPGWSDGWSKRRLPRIGFVPYKDRDAFGFLDPASILRACHLMPAFSQGRTSELLPHETSIARREGESDDWENYYVGIFVDRDMMMRYKRGSVGHHDEPGILDFLGDEPEGEDEPEDEDEEEEDEEEEDEEDEDEEGDGEGEQDGDEDEEELEDLYEENADADAEDSL
ncbi:hypothetical protein EXIGLDRAFT_607198 [Exidia glandulosa HHB12029]|uniref:Uncharacterized protein n=1 Tax=Exidia glandulosa HHB12029 TaxID=1314781 RepID=A0A165LQJ1_EXIGL|nr:hypothetical protein EXIGLDRAFT_607198 [Exidia glandulosa HHB12029]